jgi:hypothetical protein
MRYYPKSATGFEINISVAESLNLLEAWEEFDGEECDSNFASEFEATYKVYPRYIRSFREERGGEVSGLTGFSEGVIYVLFDRDEEGEDWDNLVKLLEEHNIELESGSWSQLG